jgi:hypothetical protein
MKSAKCSVSNFSKSFWTHVINFIDAISTGVCSIAAFVCLVVLDGWVLKLIGVVGCLGLVCLIIYFSDRLKEKVR